MDTLRYFLREIPKRPLCFLLRRARDAAFGKTRSLFTSLGFNPYRGRYSFFTSTSLGKLVEAEAVDCILEQMTQECPGELALLRGKADRICRHEFEIYSRSYPLTGIINWDQDFESGCRWPTRFHYRYTFAELLDSERETDVKVPWEFGRMQYLPLLSLAYRHSGQNRYVAAARELFEGFDRANPVGHGIQWVVGMEVALRAISLILCAELLAGTPEIGRLVDQRFFNVLEEHGRFLYRNIEYSDINGNHHTSCLVGLLYLGCWLHGAREALLWRRRAVRGLRKEILCQTYSDGVCHEGSIPYHRLVTELFLHAYFVAARYEIDLGDSYSERLRHMVEFISAYLKPTGSAPVWGDADDGRVHSLGSQPVNDHRYLVTIGAALLRIDRLLGSTSVEPRLSLDSTVLLDKPSLDLLLKARDSAVVPPQDANQGFASGGFYFLRRKDDYCMVDCGDVGLRGRGGHGHNDALSLEVSLAGYDVLSDTGCSSYTRRTDDRRYCLSARSHNAPLIDSKEPAPLVMSRWPHATKSLVEVVSWRPDLLEFSGRVYVPAANGGVESYQRSIRLLERPGSAAITDYFTGHGRHSLEWNFLLAAGWVPVGESTTGLSFRHEDHDVRCVFTCERARGAARVVKRRQFPTYAFCQYRNCITLELHTEFPVEVRFELAIEGTA